MRNNNSIIKVPVVFPFFAHYREGVVEELCRHPESGIEYEMISGRTANHPSLQLIAEERAELPLAKGGLPWRFTKNRWLGKAFLWQDKIWRLPFQYRGKVVILMGVSYYLSTLLAMIVAKFTGTRILLWTHGFRRDSKRLRDSYRNLFYRLADGFLLYGNRGREIMVKRGFKPEKLYVIYNSLNYRRQREIRDRINFEQARKDVQALFNCPAPVLVWSGRLIEGKKIEMLIEAAAEIKKSGQSVNLLLLGDGPLRQQLQLMAANLGIEDHCYFHGACYDEKLMANLFAGSDLCVSPGPIGLLAMHAMTYGLPVLTNSNLDGQGPEVEAVVPGRTGAFFVDDDLDDLVKQIDYCLHRSFANREQAGRWCYEIIEKFYNPQRMVEEINRAVLGQPPSVDQPASLFTTAKPGG